MTIIISEWGCFATEKNIQRRGAENAEKGSKLIHLRKAGITGEKTKD